MKKLFVLTLVLGLFSFSEWPVSAQDQPAAQPSAEELEKKAATEKNAYRLLDQVIDEAQSLRLAENRVRVQINAADMLWDQNQARSRSLFSMAAEGVAELGRAQANSTRRPQPGANVNSFVYFEGNGGGAGPPNLRSFQLRQELVLTAARHDAALAYQLLAATKLPASAQPTADPRGPRANITSDDALEQQLLSRIAALDPKFAAQNAEQMLDKGKFPATLADVITQLRKQDREAADKLADKTVKKIQAANLLTSNETTGLVQTLLRPGPRTSSAAADSAAAKAPVSRWDPVLDQTAYVDLLSAAVDAALKATPPAQGAAAAQQRLRPGAGNGPQQPTDAQIELMNSRRFLAGLQFVMPMVDQYLPSKAQSLRQKLTDMGMPSIGMNVNQFQGEMTIDSLVQAAATAPQQMQSRLYQQAAYKALEEGDTERARQIANDHLQNSAIRDNVMRRIDFSEMAKKAEGARVEDVRQAVGRLQSDDEKINFLVQVANDSQKDNPKLALQLLEDARQITNHRATAYQHFEQQLKVAHAFAELDPARSFEMLDSGISHLNELLGAAAMLSGFEVNMFRDGEMAMQGGNGLTNMVNRFGQELALLAKSDFDRSETLAGRFQFAEARIMTRLSIVQGLLSVRPAGSRNMSASRQD